MTSCKEGVRDRVLRWRYSSHAQQYKQHERSRESIELAFDSILQKKYKLRHKYGFRPPATGRKTDLAADEEVLNPMYTAFAAPGHWRWSYEQLQLSGSCKVYTP